MTGADNVLSFFIKADGTNIGAAAGTSAVTSAVIDALNADWFKIQILFGDNTNTGTFTAKLQGSNDNSTFSDIAGSACTTTTAGATDTDYYMPCTWTERNPQFRYYRIYMTRGTANTVVTAVAVQVCYRQKPPTVTTGTIGLLFASTGAINLSGAVAGTA